MGEVIQFPQSLRLQMFLAEEYSRHEMRQELGACVGLLHGIPSYEEIEEMAARLKKVCGHLDAILGIREACK